jgi:gliding motility-associated-like protein
MIKLLASVFMFVLCSLYAKADHITGGEVFYTLLNVTNGKYNYGVTLKLFMRCNSGRQFNNPATISVFDKGSNKRILDIPVNLGRTETIQLTNPSRCITDPPTVCYQVGYYELLVSVPPSEEGYVISGQFNYRISGIQNLAYGYGALGASYTAEIPGTKSGSLATNNNSAQFTGSDLVIICADNSFSYSFAAIDPDHDQLRYSFCNAYAGGLGGGPNSSAPPAAPPYQSVPYGTGYGPTSPLGKKVSINPATGLITGIAPDEAGVYVVTVCVEELRNGNVIATQRKDIQIAIAPCTIAEAKLEPEYSLCRESKTLDIKNLSNSPMITSQHWEILDRHGGSLLRSTAASLRYTFADTGLYSITLVINKGQECSDSTSALVRVYPGFRPAFTASGTCFNKPTKVTDLSTSGFGRVTSWLWEFGENSPGASSSLQNPQFTYLHAGSKIITLYAGDSFGCLDTAIRILTIVEKPPVKLAFKDTLICKNDEVVLKAAATGRFTWSPKDDMINGNTMEPTVRPTRTTTFYVDLNDDGCLNRDSVRVRVTDKVNLVMMRDTTICQGDKIQLKINSDGFHYSWLPSTQMANANEKNPVVATLNSTVYRVTAFIGGCSATGEVAVATVPYPKVNAGADTVICFNSFANLHAVMDGNTVRWSPASSLSFANSLHPVARPSASTAYVCFASDSKGCPKPGTDTVFVKVLPDILAYAGRDTNVVAGQPLQLAAAGGVRYLWSPSTGLSSISIANPVASYEAPTAGIKYRLLVYNEAGCVDSSFITVRVFKTRPSVFVPNAFSPNGDGRNETLRPIAAGLKRIEFFHVYNRWGQLLFATTETGKGWDGTVAGKPQSQGSFVWMVKAIDYTGAVYLKKGTVTLVR